MKEKRVLNPKGAMLGKQELENYLERMASNHVLQPFSERDTYPIPRLRENVEVISDVYNLLNEHLKMGITIHPAGEWILDNFYIIDETAKSIESELTLKKYRNFLGIGSSIDKGFARVYVLASEIVAFTNGKIEGNNLKDLLKSYQNKKTLNMDEIWNIGLFIQISLIENIRDIAEKIYSVQMQKYKVENIVERLVENVDRENQKYKNIPSYNSKFMSYKDMKYPFIEYLSYKLKKYGKQAHMYLNVLEEEVNKMGTDISEVIRKEHFDVALRKVTMGNCILSLKEVSHINFLQIFEEINGVEEILKLDPAGIYENMDYRTKDDYRTVIQKISNKTRISEIYIAKKALELASKRKEKSFNTKEDVKQAHIGYYLISDGKIELYQDLGVKKKSKKLTPNAYIFIIQVISLLISLILSCYILKKTSNIIFAILNFILLYVPCVMISTKLVQYLLGKFVKPKRIPKMDFLQGVPEEYSTIVVVPTIIKSKEKVKELFKNLEVYSIANDSKNVYFALLGDCSSGQNELEKWDEEVKRAGIEEASKLNKKYENSNFPKFSFIYRKRIWNEKEKCYLGWERKRGLLNQFNEYILGHIENPFLVNTIENWKQENNKIPHISYILTLDQDTSLVLNSGLELIGAMAHSLNMPILNKEETAVIDGYALIQPHVGIDLEASNKTKFTKLFAGYGGIDSYSNAISDIYQDNFGEGIFTGKGIYDLEIFSKVLNSTIPENKVLSHDLLEGCFLRCGLASDITILDGYPTKYNSFMMRLYRWIRGDVQILPYLRSKLKTKDKPIKNPLGRLCKYKILDNLIRETHEISFFALLAFLIFLNIKYKISIAPVVVTLFISICMPSIIEIINRIVFKKDGETGNKKFTAMECGIKASFKRGILAIMELPYRAYISLKAIIKTLYRMLITKEHMLEWITAEEAEKNAKKDVISYYKILFPNVILGIIGIFLGAIFYENVFFKICMFLISALFIIAPIIFCNISKENKNRIKLSEKDEEFLQEIGKRTWKFFKDYITKENNYLPPDNYQEGRKPRVVNRTSSTNIGLGLLAIISAYDMRYISKAECIELLKNMLTTIDNMQKWNGHLYNWYRIDTLQPLAPRYISTVDSGNFTGYLYVVKSFLEENEEVELIPIVDKIIKEADFSKLYDEHKRIFSIGFNVEENKLTDSYYDLLATEARQASLIAIAKKQVPDKHWYNLGRTLTILNGYKGLISWSGTAFEYLMPNINIPSYQGSLLDESCKFMVMSQKEYCKKLGIPWGISESAFSIKDLNHNYQYKAFGIPWLGLKRGLSDDIVVAPYGSILALNEAPESVVNNIKVLEKEELFSEYGFYEAIDYTPSRLKTGKTSEVVKTYMAHHQGLILLSINNFFNNNILQERFMDNPEIKAVDILLQERIPENVIITKEKKEKVEKPKYVDYSEYSERTYNKIENRCINSNIISNDHYSIIINDKGEGFSKLNQIQINKYKETDSYPQGIFFFLKSIKNKRIWVSPYAKYLSKPDKYKVAFYPDKSKFTRIDGNIESKLQIGTAIKEGTEIRYLELTNHGLEDDVLEVTSYFEPVLSPKEDEYAHPAFNNLFLRYEYDEETNGIIIKRNNRDQRRQEMYLGASLHAESNMVGELEFEIDKEKFFGRGNVEIPKMVENSIPMSKKIELVTDPCLCFRRTVKIKPEETVKLALVISTGKTKEEVKEELKSYQNIEEIKRSFELSRAKTEAENRYLGIEGKQVDVYQKIGRYIVFVNPLKKLNMRNMKIKNFAQEDLWKYGVSGDLPILLVRIKDVNDSGVLEEVIRAYEFLRMKNIECDLVILNGEEPSYERYVKEAIEGVIQNRNVQYLKNIRSGIFVFDENELENKEILTLCAKLIIDCHEGNLALQLKDLEDEYIENLKNIGNDPQKQVVLIENQVHENKLVEKNLKYYNEYGGFSENGDEYHIRVNRENRLPSVWSHILANQNFGTLVTESMGGYTWNENCRLNRLTAWGNNQVIDMPSEIVFLKDMENNKTWSLGLNPMPDENDYYVTYGFGYAKYSHTSSEIVQETDIFVPLHENVKVQILTLKNTSSNKKELKLVYYIKPVLGEDELKTNGYIETKFHEKSNLVSIVNHFQKEKNVAYIASSEKIKSYTGSAESFVGKCTMQNPEGLKKVEQDMQNSIGSTPCVAIQMNISLEPYEKKEISILLGEEKVLLDAQEVSYRYSNLQNCKQELENTRKYYKELIGKVQVTTPVESMNILLNGWLTYQTIISRLWAKTGFYQSGGAFGFRDQLQDTLGLKFISTEFMKGQIRKAAKHQFPEGDVEHWWHEKTGKGIRTRFSDDLLWLPYVVEEYIQQTGDYSLLQEELPYIQGQQLEEGQDERYDYYPETEYKESLYNHCIKAIERSLNFGENDLPKIGSGDWNDGFSTVGNKGIGESIWLRVFPI